MAAGRPMSNATIRVLLDAVEEVYGEHGHQGRVKCRGSEQVVDNFPPKDLEMVADFSEYGAIQQAVKILWPPRRAGHALAHWPSHISLWSERPTAILGLAGWYSIVCRAYPDEAYFGEDGLGGSTGLSASLCGEGRTAFYYIQG